MTKQHSYSKFEQQLTRLNQAQKHAVETIEGPVLMLAGPGSGKTQVIAMRIANIIRQTDIAPSAILALTFTEKAAANMRSRLVEIIGTTAYQINIATFHGFCNEIINQYQEEFIFAKELKQLDELTRVKLLTEIIEQADLKLLRPFSAPLLFLPAIQAAISSLKKEGLAAAKFYELVEQHQANLEQLQEVNPKTGKLKQKWQDYSQQIIRNRELASIYRLYESELRQRGLYDFEDMIRLVTAKLEQDESFLANLQERILYTLVDEYQDTNGAQNKLLMLLNSYDDRPNLFVVGDEDQAIFSFQGANIRNILEFKQRFSAAAIITTTFNYRSHQGILDVAGKIIEQNPDRFTKYFPEIEKKLVAAQQSTSQTAKPVKKLLSTNNLQEAEIVAQEIDKLHEQGTAWEEIAVIYRNNSDVADLIVQLELHNIPYTTDSLASILNNLAVSQALSLLKVLAEPTNSTQLVKVLHYANWQLDQADLYKALRLYGQARRYNELKLEPELLDFLLDENALLLAGVETPANLKAVAQALLHLRQRAFNQSLPNLLAEVLTTTGLLSQAVEAQDFNTINAFHSIKLFLEQQLAINPDYGLNDFSSDLVKLQDNKININTKDITMYANGVRLLTAHKAKGLEFDHVFIIKTIDKHWGNKRNPDRLKLLNLYDLDFNDKAAAKAVNDNEERRLFFVALTRARKQLYLSYAETYLDAIELKAKPALPSLFIAEIPPAYQEIIDYRKQPTDTASTLLAKTDHVTVGLTPASRDYLTAILANQFKLSASALNTYLECPTRFLYLCLLNAPKQQDLSLQLGTSVHKALEGFGKSKLAGKTLSISELVEIAQQYLQAQGLPPTDLEPIAVEASQILSTYYPELVSQRLATVAVEYHFSKNLTWEGIPLRGRIDLIEQASPERVNLVDYKTTRPQSIRQIQTTADTDTNAGSYYRQLLFYYLLAQLEPSFKLKVNQVGLAFVKPNNSGKFKRQYFQISDSELVDFKTLVRDTWQRITKLEFDNRCAKRSCSICSLLT